MTLIIIILKQRGRAKMNISGNNQQHEFQAKQGTLSVMGNNNQIILSRCQAHVNVMGNGNTFFFSDCQAILQINGNGNTLQAHGSKLAIGVNGNGNDLNSSSSDISISNCNGFGNNIQASIQNATQCNPNYGNIFGQQNVPTNCNYQNVFGGNHQGQMRNNQYHHNYNQQLHPYQRYTNNTNNTTIPNSLMETNQQQRRPARNYNSNYTHISNNNSRDNPNSDYIPSRHSNRRRGPIALDLTEEIQPQINHRLRGPSRYAFQANESQGLTKNEINQLPLSKYTGSPTKCSICLDQITVGSDVMYLLCFHSFHSHCCSDWLRKKPTCPLCQANMKQQIQAHQQ